MKISVTILFLFFNSIAHCQNIFPKLTMDLELATERSVDRLKWFDFAPKNKYIVEIDTVVKKAGRQSVSIKSIEISPKESWGGFGSELKNIYKGKEIEIKSYIKLENVDGMALLVLRTNNNDKVLSFDNMKKKNVNGSKDWKQYSVKFPLDENTTHILIGGMLLGQGKIWFDDFRLLIDGKEVKDFVNK